MWMACPSYFSWLVDHMPSPWRLNRFSELYISASRH
jgi:hypothetical protein